MVAMKYNIVIDCAVGAPGHGKDVVDGLNAVDKRFLRKSMFQIFNPEEGTTRKAMHAHGADSRGMVSFAEECRKLLQQHADHASSMISSKSSKREDNRKFQTKFITFRKRIQSNTIK